MQRIFNAGKYNYIFFILLLWSLNIYFYKPNRDHWQSYLFQFAKKVVPSSPNQNLRQSLKLYDLRRTSSNSDDLISTTQRSIYTIYDMIFTTINYFNSSISILIVIFFIITGILIILANTSFLLLVFRYGKDKLSLLIFFFLIIPIEIFANFFNKGQSVLIWNKYINNESEINTYNLFSLLFEHIKILILPSSHYSVFGLEPRNLVLLIFTIYYLEYYILRKNNPLLLISLAFIHLPTAILIKVILLFDNMIQTRKFNREKSLLMAMLTNSIVYFLFTEHFGIYIVIFFIVSNLLIINKVQKNKYFADLKLGTSFMVWGLFGIIIILFTAISFYYNMQEVISSPYWFSSSLIELSGRYFSVFRIIFLILISTQLYRIFLTTELKGINIHFTPFSSKINIYFMICTVTIFVTTIKMFELYLFTK